MKNGLHFWQFLLFHDPGRPLLVLELAVFLLHAIIVKICTEIGNELIEWDAARAIFIQVVHRAIKVCLRLALIEGINLFDESLDGNLAWLKIYCLLEDEIGVFAEFFLN